VLYMLQWLYTCVACVCFRCFSCFKRTLQVFHLYVCCKYVFQMFSAVSSRCCICCSGYTCMLQVYIPNVSPISNICCKCFIWMLLYVAVVIHIYCKRMFQLFHLVSICSRGCCTHPFSAVMRASSNSQTCTHRAVSAQMAEQPLVKVHARIQSARACPHPTDAEPDALAPPRLVSHGGACNRGQHG
jgi:hypothetical protein